VFERRPLEQAFLHRGGVLRGRNRSRTSKPMTERSTLSRKALQDKASVDGQNRPLMDV
jgi:hypothetical protein